MKVATWNINSLRARFERVCEFLETSQVDVLLIQETKCKDDNFPEFDIRTLGYDVSHYGLSQYNGVAIISKSQQKNTTFGLGSESDPYIADARILKSEIEGISFVSVYAPNGRDVTSEHYKYKLDWYDLFADYAKNLIETNEQIVIAGDLNIAPTDKDVWDIKEFPLSTHVTDLERNKYQSLLSLGLTDAFDLRYPSDEGFTFWDYRGGDFHKNKGMRIDFFLVSDALKNNISDVYVERESRKGSKPSDHAALIMELDIKR